MMKKDIKRAARILWHHSKILFTGFYRMLFGTAIAVLIALTVYGFAMIPQGSGYVAVCEFIGSTATVCVAFAGMYAMGCGKKKGVKKNA